MGSYKVFDFLSHNSHLFPRMCFTVTASSIYLILLKCTEVGVTAKHVVVGGTMSSNKTFGFRFTIHIDS